MSVLISVVIPTYQRVALLTRCLDMLMLQRFDADSFEVIVVSDGPHRPSEVKVNEYLANPANPVVRYRTLPKRMGPAAARNLGWRQAIGNLIAFTDDDCLPDPGWLEAAWIGFKSTDDRAGAFTGRVIVPCPWMPTDYERNVSHLETAEFVTANCFCTRSALESVKGFDERFPIAWREDSDLEFSLLNCGIPIRYLDQACVIHPVRTGSWGISLREQKKTIYNALLYKKFPGLYRTRIQPRPPWHYYLAVIFFVIFLASCTNILPVFLLLPALILWFVVSGSFLTTRLRGTSHAPGHVLEMIVTSLCIPFLSVFWRLYGALKYKTLFL